MLMNKDLVIIGGHANFCEAEQDMAFGDLPVPIIVSKDCDRTTRIFRLGTMHNTPNDQTRIHISNPTHPLAAGLMGDVAVFPSNSRIVNASDLGPKAVVIATTLAGGNPCIFYYDKGDAMLNGFIAPGKRMGFFWHRPTAAPTVPRSCSRRRSTGCCGSSDQGAIVSGHGAAGQGGDLRSPRARS
jgi:hypothetical protein